MFLRETFTVLVVTGLRFVLPNVDSFSVVVISGVDGLTVTTLCITVPSVLVVTTSVSTVVPFGPRSPTLLDLFDRLFEFLW